MVADLANGKWVESRVAKDDWVCLFKWMSIALILPNLLVSTPHIALVNYP